MKKYEENWIRLPLEKAYNVRELGGYPTIYNNKTAYHQFLRADDMSGLSDSDVEFLLNYGVKTVIDLRSDQEAKELPDKFMNMSNVNYVRIPYLGRNLTDVTKMDKDDMEKGLSAMYINMLQNNTLTSEIFNVIANANEGCILFHCTVGKDRTGVLAMLILSLAGVDKYDCISNYEQSFTNLCRKPGYLEMVEQARKYNMDNMLYSKAKSMEVCYDWLISTYGSTENYLNACGVDKKSINKVRNKLLSYKI